MVSYYNFELHPVVSAHDDGLCFQNVDQAYELIELCIFRADAISSSFICLNVPVCATPPVIAAPPTSFINPAFPT